MAYRLNVKIGGPAGSGVFTLGETVAKILKYSGLWTYCSSDYPSLIKGGHNQYVVHASDKKIYSSICPVDILVCLDKKTAELHASEIHPNGALIYDSSLIKNLQIKNKKIVIVPIEMSEIAKQIGSSVYASSIAFGAVCGLIGVEPEFASKLIHNQFDKKGPEIVKHNLDAFTKGVELSQHKNLGLNFKTVKDYHRIMLDGNMAISLGAIKAGCKFISAYPMTPATSIIQNIAAQELKYNIIAKQTEDEISAINMAIGAAFTGVRSMTATSGGGFALMVEALGMAGIAEIPLVIVESQRAGPSTGLPTYTSQEDLRFVQHASQGEFPRIVVAPGDVEECFNETFNAFNLAEIYQTPVIILVDKELSNSVMTVERFKDKGMKIKRGKLLSDSEVSPGFKRYKFTKDGISPRCLPGQQNGMHVASSYEHDETGYTSEEADMHVMQIDKRMRKLDNIYDKIEAVSVYGNKNPDIQLIIWGSTKGACIDALDMLSALKIKAKIVQVKYICPFPVKQFMKLFNPKIPALLLEHNKTGQLRGIIRENTGILIPNYYGKYDARPICPEIVVEQARKVLKK